MNSDKLSVLVVEDSPPVRDLLTESLRDAGCDVTAVWRVTDALLALDTQHLDLVLADLNLGEERSGWEIVERHRRASDPLIVVLSGSHDPADAERAMACGAPYLLKPASASQIATVLQAALRRRELCREGRRHLDR